MLNLIDYFNIKNVNNLELLRLFTVHFIESLKAIEEYNSKKGNIKFMYNLFSDNSNALFFVVNSKNKEERKFIDGGGIYSNGFTLYKIERIIAQNSENYSDTFLNNIKVELDELNNNNFNNSQDEFFYNILKVKTGDVRVVETQNTYQVLALDITVEFLEEVKR